MIPSEAQGDEYFYGYPTQQSHEYEGEYSDSTQESKPIFF